MKSFLSFILFSSLSNGFIDPKAFQSSNIYLEEEIINQTINNQFQKATSAISDEVIKNILEDNDNRVSDEFHIHPYFENNVRFWFSIYTQFSSKQVIIHDKEDLSIVYNTLDFSELHNSNVNRYAKAKLQADLSLEYSQKVKSILSNLHKDKSELSEEEKGILIAIEKSIKVPDSARAKKKLFRRLSQNIRTQTGQRDMVFNAILRSLPYLPFLERQLKNFDIPKELLSISFIESSFNYKAESYAGAKGAWQFMPSTSRYFMPKITRSVDYRSNVVISSLAAFHLLKQNKQIVKRWDLAIPAYNFGPTKIQRFRMKYKGTTTLPIFIQENEDKAIGFASTNYYSEFIALSHALAYRDKIYNIDGYKEDKNKFNVDNIHVYVTKCTFNPRTFYRLLKRSSPNTNLLNTHFKNTRYNYKNRPLIVSDVNLTSRKYYKLSDKELKAKSPKYYYTFAKKSKCR